MTRGMTIGNIKKQLRKVAPYIASQYSALWDDMVRNELFKIERLYRDRLNDAVFDDMHDYGMEHVRRIGL